MIIGIPIYQKVDLLDVAAPAEIFDSMRTNAPQLNVEVCLIAEDDRDVVTKAGVTIRPTSAFTKFRTSTSYGFRGAIPRL